MEPVPEPEDFSKISLEERIQHKAWKARCSAYEELAKKFSTFDEKEYSKFGPLVKKFVIDTNAAAQEKGLAAVLVFVDYAPNAGKYVDSILAGIVTKCLTSPKPKTKELAVEIILKCVEIEKQDVTLEELIKGLDQKVPKNVAAVIRVIRECLIQFGAKVIAIKPLIPHLSRLLEDRDATIRDETKKLTIEIYRWVKDALLPQLSNLKPLLLDPLKEEFEKVKAERAVRKRLLRSQQDVVQEDDLDGSAGADDEASVEPEQEEEVVDPFEFLDPVDIISKLPSDFFTQLESKKWSERKDELEKLQQLCEQNPKLLTTSDYSELVKALKRIVSKDTNVIVAVLGIKCIAFLATGLRKAGFEKYANGCITVFFEKFKEKKPNVVCALRDSSDAVYLCTTLESFHEDAVTALDNKNPSIRSESALFLARCFAKTNPAQINKKLLKTLVTALLKTLSDSDGAVRESSAAALGTCYKQQGERNMLPLLQDLEALKMAKIKEHMEKAVVTKFAAPAPAPAAKSKGPPGRKPGVGVKKGSSPSDNDDYDLGSVDLGPAPKAKAQVVKPVTRVAAASKVPAKRPATTALTGRSGSAISKPSASSSANAASSSPLMPVNMNLKEQRINDEKTLKVLKWNFSAPREEFYTTLKDQLIAAEWNTALIALMFNSDFKFHIKAIEQMTTFFNDPNNQGAVAANIDLVLKWFALRFFDTNPAMVLKGLDLVILMFKILNSEGKQLHEFEATSFLPYLILKLGEQKEQIKNKAHEILELSRGIYSPIKICAHLHALLQSKNARLRANCLEEIASLIEWKGVAIFGPPNSIQMLRDIAKLVGDRDNTIRNSVLKCILHVYHFEGEKVLKMINASALNEKDLNFIEERIKRAPKPKCQTEPEPPVQPPPIAAKPSGIGGIVPRFGLAPKSSNNDEPKSRFGMPQSSLSGSSINSGTMLKSSKPSLLSGMQKFNSATMLRRPLETNIAPPKDEAYDCERQDYNPPQLPPQTQTQEPRRPRFMPRSDSSSVVSTDSDDLINVVSKASPFANRVQQALLNPSTVRAFGSPQGVNHETTEKLMSIFEGLSSTEPSVATEALHDLKDFFNDYEKYEIYLSGKSDQFAVLFNKQLRLFYKKYQEGTATPEYVKLFRHTVQRIRQIFNLSLSKRISRDSLLEMITHLMPFFIAMRTDKMIAQVVCLLPVEMVTGSDPTNLICALYRKMGNYVDDLVTLKDKPEDYERVTNCLEFTMKFVWRSLKYLDDTIHQMNIDLILLESHNFFREYPRSFFKKNGINELPLKTVKTLLFSLTQKLGESILNHFTLINNKDESDMFLYVQRGLRHSDSATSAHSTSASSTNSQNQAKENAENSGSKTATIISNGSNPYENHFNVQNRHLMNCPDDNPASQELQNYCDYVSKQLNVNLDYQKIVKNAPIFSTVKEVDLAVQEARRKKEEFVRLHT